MCSFYVQLIDYEYIKYYTVCVDSCGAKKALRDLWKLKESAFDLDSAMSWKISGGKIDINDHVAVTAWLAPSTLLSPIFCATISPGHVPKPTFHFITALLGAFFGGRESLKLGSILMLMQVCAHSASHEGFALPIKIFFKINPSQALHYLNPLIEAHIIIS